MFVPSTSTRLYRSRLWETKRQVVTWHSGGRDHPEPGVFRPRPPKDGRSVRSNTDRLWGLASVGGPGRTWHADVTRYKALSLRASEPQGSGTSTCPGATPTINYPVCLCNQHDVERGSKGSPWSASWSVYRRLAGEKNALRRRTCMWHSKNGARS